MYFGMRTFGDAVGRHVFAFQQLLQCYMLSDGTNIYTSTVHYLITHGVDHLVASIDKPVSISIVHQAVR